MPLALSALLLAPGARAVDLDSVKQSITNLDAVKPSYNSWRIVPMLDLREIYTDNVTLQPSGQTHGQFITEVSPGILINHKGPRLKLDGQYQLHLYAHTGDNYGGRKSSSYLRANAQAELVDNMVFVDSSASMQLQSISPFAPLVSGNEYANTNSANVKTWQVSPYMRNRYGHFASSELRYLHDAVDAGNSALGNTQGDTVSFRLNSGVQWDRLNWGVSGSNQKIHEKIRSDSTIRTAVVNLGYRLVPTFAVTAAGYYDDYDYHALSGSHGGSGAMAGFRWNPSRRTSVDASFGHRYYGPSRSLKALHRSRRTTWDISYDDSVTTSRANFLRQGSISPGTVVPGGPARADLGGLFTPEGPPLIVPPPAIPPGLTDNLNFFSNRFFLQKQLRANMSLRTARTTAAISLYKVRREALSLGDAIVTVPGAPLDALNDNLDQVGLGAVATYTLTPRSNLALSTDLSNNKSLTTGFKARASAVRLTLSHQIGRNIGASAELRRVTGVTGLTRGPKYTENALSVALNMKL